MSKALKHRWLATYQEQTKQQEPQQQQQQPAQEQAKPNAGVSGAQAPLQGTSQVQPSTHAQPTVPAAKPGTVDVLGSAKAAAVEQLSAAAAVPQSLLMQQHQLQHPQQPPQPQPPQQQPPPQPATLPQQQHQQQQQQQQQAPQHAHPPKTEPPSQQHPLVPPPPPLQQQQHTAAAKPSGDAAPKAAPPAPPPPAPHQPPQPLRAACLAGHHHPPHSLSALNRTKSGNAAAATSVLGGLLDTAITLSATPVSRPPASSTPGAAKGRHPKQQEHSQQRRQEQQQPLAEKTDKGAGNKAAHLADRKGAAAATGVSAAAAAAPHPSGSGNCSPSSHDQQPHNAGREEAASRPHIKIEPGKEPATAAGSTAKAVDKKAAADKRVGQGTVTKQQQQQQQQQQRGAAPANAASSKTAGTAGMKRKVADGPAAGSKGMEEQPAAKKKPLVGLIKRVEGISGRRVTAGGEDDSDEGATVVRRKLPPGKQQASAGGSGPAAAGAVGAGKDLSKVSGSEHATIKGTKQRPEPGGANVLSASQKQASSKPAVARTQGAASTAAEPGHKMSRLAKQSSTTAACAAAAATSTQDAEEPQCTTPRANAKQLVLAKHERQDREERQQRQHQQQATGSDHAAEVKPSSSDKQQVLAGGRTVAVAPGASADDTDQPEVFVEPPGGGKWLQAQLQLSKVHNFQQLFRQLQGEFPHMLPDRDVLRIKVVYLDGDGDWVMAMPDQRWRSFVEVAKKVLVCHTP